MKYYLIAGEASGDLHASRLMRELKACDPAATFRFYGGDEMQTVGGTRVKHYRELAYMGFVPVLMHLPTILQNMRNAKRDIAQWQPDVVILVDYPGFNLSVARFVKQHAICPVYYYISPKIWAWKEYRIKNIRRDVDQLFSILPFEVDFFEKKHHYPIHYVGNPTAQEVDEFLLCCHAGTPANTKTGEHSGTPSHGRKVIALLAGSRRQEIKDNLPAMIKATSHLANDYDLVVAGAPSIDTSYYNQFIDGTSVRLVENQTYQLLASAHAALVTSGTATLETALFGVPQVVCYKTPLPPLTGWLRRRVIKVPFISLVNLIAGYEVVTELVADSFSVENIRRELTALLQGGQRQKMLDHYAIVRQHLGTKCAPKEAAGIIVRLLSKA